MNLRPIELSKDTYPILFQENNLGKQHYKHVRTIDAAKVIMDAGWLPREVISMKPRLLSRIGFQKHRIRFFNPNLPTVNGSFVESLLTNSYDTKSTFIFQFGVFRMICSNGMVVGDTFAKESVRHLGYTDQKVHDAINKILPQTENILSSIDRFSSTQLTSTDQKHFGQSILEMRLDKKEGWILDDKAIASLYSSHRYADNVNDLWTTFNRAQENLCRVGFNVSRKDPEEGYIETRKVRAIKNNFRADSVNSALWTLAEDMYEFKNSAIA